jgi:hypothetical protein
MAFAYTEALRGVLKEIVQEVDLFSHVRLDEVVVSFAQARSRSLWGIYAKLVPLRFEGGKLEGVQDGYRWEVDPFTFRGQDVLYILYVYLPRFHEQDFFNKILTLFHELYHISPKMNGDLRRFPGPNHFHGPSREWYDDQLRPTVQAFLERRSSLQVLDFLREDLETLVQRNGDLSGLQVRQPTWRKLGRVLEKKR